MPGQPKTTDTDTDTQDLSISGNVISLTNGGSVDLTSALTALAGDGLSEWYSKCCCG